MYKIKVGVGFADDGTVKVEYTKLNSDAHVTMTKQYRTDMLQHMEDVGLINLGMGQIAKKIKLNYVREGEELIKVTEFDCTHVYYEYLKKGGKLVYCKDCGNLILSNSITKPSTQCKQCRREKQLEQQKNSMAKARS